MSDYVLIIPDKAPVISHRLLGVPCTSVGRFSNEGPDL
jgi:hypothetical protein